MKTGTRITISTSLVLVLCLIGSIIVSRHLATLRSDAAIEEVLYIPSAKLLKKACFGHSGLLADVYWTRAVQYFGTLHHQRSSSTKYDLLYPLLDITTTLDPQLLPAYQFGSIFLSQKPPEGAGQPDKAAELVRRGIAANPNRWQLYYNLGFIYYEAKDYEAAARAFGEGAQVPGANHLLAALQASMASEAGSPETAAELWGQLYATSEDKSIRATAEKHLIALRIDDDVVKLARLVSDYRDRTGQYPANFQEMVAAGWLTRVPLDPLGDAYLLRSAGKVEIQSPQKKPFVNYGLPGGPQGPVQSQSASNP